MFHPEQTQEMMAYWQPMLGLENWRVDVTRHRSCDMPSPSTMGTMGWSLAHQLAWLELTTPSDLKSEMEEVYDEEEVIIHELLHLLTAELWDRIEHHLGKVEKETCVERPINVLSGMLKNFRKESDHQWSWERNPPNPLLSEFHKQQKDDASQGAD